MPRSLALYCDDLLKASDRIFAFVRTVDRAQYDDSELIRSAVERQFLILGEVVSQIRRHYPEVLHTIDDSNQIIGFRNVLAHQYLTVDDNDVWSAIETKLPAFRQQVAELMAKL